MSFSSDVKAITTTDSGHKIDGRTRLQGVQYVHGGLSAGITLSFLDSIFLALVQYLGGLLMILGL